MTAWVFVAAPKLRPLAGMPPITPGRQRDEVDDLLLIGDRSDTLGHTDPEIDDAVGVGRNIASTLYRVIIGCERRSRKLDSGVQHQLASVILGSRNSS